MKEPSVFPARDERTSEQASSQKARELSSLLALEAELTTLVNAGLPAKQILSRFLERVHERGFAEGMLLTFKSWPSAKPALIAERLEKVGLRWSDFQERTEIDAAHSAKIERWPVTQVGGGNQRRCLSLCFSTNGSGAVALTAVDPRTSKALLELRDAFSPAIEHLLIERGYLAPGDPPKDMATMTLETLEAAQGALGEIMRCNEGSPERVAAQVPLLFRLRELRSYTHFQKRLAEVSAALLVVTSHAGRETLTQPNLDALRDVFGRMAKIQERDFTTQDADWCVQRLARGGLDIFDAFGEERLDDAGA